jgi:LppX/LprAFG-like lipoprotein
MRRLLCALLLVASCLSACGFGASPPDGPSVLAAAGRALASVRTVSADVKFGPGIVLQGLTLSSASSKIALPSDSDTTFKVRQGDFLVDVRFLTVGGQAYLQLPFSKFSALSPAQAAEVPNLAGLFDATRGLPAVLPRGQGATWQASEKVGGVDCDRVAATYTPEQVGQVLAASGARPAGSVRAVLWVASGDHLLRRLLLTGPLLEAGKDISVDITLHDYNAPVSITPPTP